MNEKEFSSTATISSMQDFFKYCGTNSSVSQFDINIFSENEGTFWPRKTERYLL